MIGRPCCSRTCRPRSLVAFVSDLKLPPRYAIALDELGYDDVDDLANLDAAAMAKFRFDLEEKEFMRWPRRISHRARVKASGEAGLGPSEA